MNSPAETGKEKVGGRGIPEPNLINFLRPLRIILKEPFAEDLEFLTSALLSELLSD